MSVEKNRRSKTAGLVPWIAAAGMSAGAIFAAAKLVRKIARPAVSLREKTVLITGGSRGLGLALARELGNQGCRLALCARYSAELDEACRRLAREGIDARPFTCDITNDSDIETLISRVLQEFGEIDILINNAGHISVGSLDTFNHSDFEQAMNVMFWAPLNLTFALLPRMKKRQRGHIVNITSVGGRVSVPHLLPYSCAKFALAGFSTGLSAELSTHGIHVLTVIPGLMRTGSYLNAEFKGAAARDEFAWFALLGNLPGFSVSAGYAAACVRKALQQQKSTCTISVPAKILIASEALMPESTRAAFKILTRTILPQSDERNLSSTGKALNPAFGRIFMALTSLGRTAAHELNE